MRAEELDFNALVYSSVQNTYDNAHGNEVNELYHHDEKNEAKAAKEAEVAFAAAVAQSHLFQDVDDMNSKNVGSTEYGTSSAGGSSYN